MGMGSTVIALSVVSILLGCLVILGLIWIVPIFLQKQKAYMKRKVVQKKVNEEMVRNIRYRSPSTVGCSPQMIRNYDYGSIQPRQVDYVSDTPSMSCDQERGDVPSINITFDEEPCIGSPDKADRDSNLDVFTDKSSLLNSKRRFSSIVFTHSDEIKVLSDDDSLEVAGEKRERRASMSLFDTCKLVCPELTQDLGHSTEHLNQITLPTNENQGKLYFMLSQNEANKGVLEVIIIKVSDIGDRKPKEYKIQMELIEAEVNVLSNVETRVKICSGEVVNFDESFVVSVEDSVTNNGDGGLSLVFTLVTVDSKKVGKITKIGEIRFDLMELIEGRVLRFDGQEQFVICRNFVNLDNKIKCKENSGRAMVFLRFTKVFPLSFVIGISELKDLISNKPFTGVNVRMSLATEGKILDTRRSKVVKKKYQTADGVLKIDESFEFNLSGKETTKLPLTCSPDSVFLTLFICGRSNIGFSHVLGKCVLGPIEFADGTGLFHWNKAISSPGEIVHHWHILKN